jgi:hypothetical protein
MSFGSNGMDRARSLRKIMTRPCLVNLCVNSTSSASLHRLSCSNKTAQNTSFGSNGVDPVRSLRNLLNQIPLVNLCVIGTCSASFASTFVQ